MPLPNDLLNFCPLESRSIPWRYTILKGISSIKYCDIKIMRATQKNNISYPGFMTLVGWKFFRSGAFKFGQPSVEKVQSPEENQVSSVSSSWIHLALFPAGPSSLGISIPQ